MSLTITRSIVAIVAACSCLIFFSVSPALASHSININTASASTLETLTGIGAVKAQAIVDYRSTNGDFNSIIEIQNVSGIGAATYDSIKDHITVSGGGSSNNDEVEQDTGSESEGTQSSSSSSDREPREPVKGITILAPKVGYVNQPITFDVEPTAGTKDRLVRYQWSFGDASMSDSKSPVHSYEHAGRYVVMVTSRYLKEEKTARHEIEIKTPEIKIERDLSGSVSVTNLGGEEIDIGGMKLSAENSFVFPKPTILLPGATLTVSSSKSKLGASSALAFLDQSGDVVASEMPVVTPQEVTPTPSTGRVMRKVSVAPEPTTSVLPVAEASEEETASSTIGGSQVAAVSNSSPINWPVPEEKLPYLGLLVVLSAALVSIYFGQAKR